MCRHDRTELVELFLAHGISPNFMDGDGLPMVLHAKTGKARSMLVEAGACIPAWFTPSDVFSSCREDENCPDVPQMTGNPKVFEDGDAGSCDERLGSVVGQAPGHLANQLLAELCPCKCGRWVAPPACSADVLQGKTEADGRDSWAALASRRNGPLPIPPEGLAELAKAQGMKMPQEVKMDL